MKRRAVYSRDCTFLTTQGWASEQLCGCWACSGPGGGTWAHLDETASQATSSPQQKGQASKQWHLPGSGASSLQVRQIAELCTLHTPCVADLHYSCDDACQWKEVSASGTALKRPFNSSWELYLRLRMVAGSPLFWQLRRARICQVVSSSHVFINPLLFRKHHTYCLLQIHYKNNNKQEKNKPKLKKKPYVVESI